jgi:DNA-directed RNA polymerase specialized sigma24 family protein
MSNSKLQHEFTQAIVAAYLITGSARQSEAAVMKAIARWEPKQGLRSVLELVAGLAVKCKQGAGDEWPLPAELQNVLRLPRNARRVFVLRILLGLSRDVCANVLGLSLDHVDQETCEALVAFGTQNFAPRQPTDTMAS